MEGEENDVLAAILGQDDSDEEDNQDAVAGHPYKTPPQPKKDPSREDVQQPPSEKEPKKEKIEEEIERGGTVNKPMKEELSATPSTPSQTATGKQSEALQSSMVVSITSSTTNSSSNAPVAAETTPPPTEGLEEQPPPPGEEDKNESQGATIKEIETEIKAISNSDVTETATTSSTGTSETSRASRLEELRAKLLSSRAGTANNTDTTNVHTVHSYSVNQSSNEGSQVETSSTNLRGGDDTRKSNDKDYFSPQKTRRASRWNNPHDEKRTSSDEEPRNASNEQSSKKSNRWGKPRHSDVHPSTEHPAGGDTSKQHESPVVVGNDVFSSDNPNEVFMDGERWFVTLRQAVGSSYVSQRCNQRGSIVSRSYVSSPGSPANDVVSKSTNRTKNTKSSQYTDHTRGEGDDRGGAPNSTHSYTGKDNPAENKYESDANQVAIGTRRRSRSSGKNRREDRGRAVEERPVSRDRDTPTTSTGARYSGSRGDRGNESTRRRSQDSRYLSRPVDKKQSQSEERYGEKRSDKSDERRQPRERPRDEVRVNPNAMPIGPPTSNNSAATGNANAVPIGSQLAPETLKTANPNSVPLGLESEGKLPHRPQEDQRELNEKGNRVNNHAGSRRRHEKRDRNDQRSDEREVKRGRHYQEGSHKGRSSREVSNGQEEARSHNSDFANRPSQEARAAGEHGEKREAVSRIHGVKAQAEDDLPQRTRRPTANEKGQHIRGREDTRNNEKNRPRSGGRKVELISDDRGGNQSNITKPHDKRPRNRNRKVHNNYKT